MKAYSLHHMITNIYKQRTLIKQFVIREIKGRYKGSYLGILWSFLTPIFMLIIYTFVFSVIFKARWGIGNESRVEFAFILFSGIIAFNIFSEVIVRSPKLIVSNVNFVKKVVFPLEILPVVAISSALVHAGISALILIAGLFFIMGVFNWTIIFLPLVLLPLLLISSGLAWLLSSLGTYFRDIEHVTGLVVSALMFLSPIFYPVTNIPDHLRFIYNINPISYLVEDMRRIMVWGLTPDWSWLIIWILIGLVISLLGYNWFQKTKGGFADVL